MTKAVIIEDEKPAARRLQRMLEKNNIHNVVLLHSIQESISWFQKQEEPDLIFLDIQLSDGISFEIFEKVTVNCPIIITTAYDQYALKAFKVNSIDYLLKPIDADDLKSALKKFDSLYKTSQSNNLNIEFLKGLINKNLTEYKERFTVQIGQHLRMIEVQDIECFYSENKASYAYIKQGKSYLLEGSLDNIKKMINPKHFYKVNRSFIVHISAIKDIISYTNSRLELKLNHFSQQEIIVSRERVKDFKRWISGY